MKSGDAAPLRLRKRKEFLAAARGWRRHASAFVLQANMRAPQTGMRETDLPETDMRETASSETAPARFGLTIAKKTVSSAVRRNRIRRRLREALRLGAADAAKPGCDYVFVARANALTLPFARLMSDMSAALAAPAQRGRSKARPASS
ncbi:MAG: ribonuclease P protein component [Rhodoblastus sp.]